MKKQIFTANVFSESGMAGGNQLAVIGDAADLSTEQMQMIARQMNYSESTFITGRDEGSVEFRIFLPTGEIPYAGHPTIGTVFIDEWIRRKGGEAREAMTAKLRAGDVPIRFEGKTPDLAYMRQLPVLDHGAHDPSDALLEALDIRRGQLATGDCPVYGTKSMKFIHLRLTSVQDLNAMSPSFMMLKRQLQPDESVIAAVTTGSVDVAMRMFAPVHGINEDPATGSAQNPLVHALQRWGHLTEQDEITVRQGDAMGRPSVLYNRISRADDGTILLDTGGRTSIIVEGTIRVS